MSIAYIQYMLFYDIDLFLISSFLYLLATCGSLTWMV